MCSDSEAGSWLRLIDFCITQLWAWEIKKTRRRHERAHRPHRPPPCCRGGPPLKNKSIGVKGFRLHNGSRQGQNMALSCLLCSNLVHVGRTAFHRQTLRARSTSSFSSGSNRLFFIPAMCTVARRIRRSAVQIWSLENDHFLRL